MGSLKKLTIALGVVGAMIGYVACFHEKTIHNHEIQCSTDPNRPCPSGFFCSDGYCYTPDLLGVDAVFTDIAAFFPDDGGDAGDHDAGQ